MNAFEAQAMEILGDRLASYPQETRWLGRLDDRIIGWMAFRPHLAYAGFFGISMAAVAGGWVAAAGGPWPAVAAMTFLAFAAGGWALGRWQWRRITLPFLEVLADAVASGRGQPGAGPMPYGMHFQLSAVVSRLRRLHRTLR